eukprot:TRINITY_DN5168_c0_g1_i2.p1 TRINITY_DN5168_c0_g1~~TRINITY_DN5168_c0_g1_i2.p1  ORF type:complete len:1176 (+),score=284.16 TRINITY_DN5168_c0_g1_i2:28-3555(+)
MEMPCGTHQPPGSEETSAKTAEETILGPAAVSEGQDAISRLSMVAAAAAGPSGPSDSDMIRRFEALSNMFKSEVEVLFGKEKESAKEDLDRLQIRVSELEAALSEERAEAGSAAETIRQFMSLNQPSEMERVFADEDGLSSSDAGAASQAVSSQRLRQIVDAFVQVNSAQVRPEVRKAQQTIDELQEQLEASRQETERLQAELLEAQRLKSQEERDLIEFKSVREKESEVQIARMEAQSVQTQIEELRGQTKQLEMRNEQQKAVMREKSEKVVELVKRLEQQGEQLRLLSDENNTLRLELGRDADYVKVISAPTDPLSYKCAAGALSDELVNEENRFREDLRSMATKFPGLPSQGRCSQWCEVQISRISGIHKSFLHRMQDHQRDFPEGVQVEFVTPGEELQSDWTQQELQMREAGAEFQEAEKTHNQKWEEHRLKLTSERDAKVKQLLDQAERSQSKAEQQLLLHQAKLFGQRVDTQLERAWEEQRKERDLRWADHQQRKNEVRQRIKDESLSMAQKAEDRASASSRFVDAAASKLAIVEDAWVRNSEKAASLNAHGLKAVDLSACLRSVRSGMASAAGGRGAGDEPKLPARGSQHTGLNQVLEIVEELINARTELRKNLRLELEEQSRQQLRGCIEKFLQREAGQVTGGEDAVELEYSQASAIVGLLQVRQHRHLSEALRRQFQDYLLVLRICTLAASWLLPSGLVSQASGSSLDLPPLPAELRDLTAEAGVRALPDGESSQEVPGGEYPDDAPVDDKAVERSFLYNSLCQRLLEKGLTLLAEAQREELLNLKQAYAGEQRLSLEHFCQLEGDMVKKIIEQDIQEFKLQVSARMLSDCERQVNEERKQLVGQVSDSTAGHVAQYRRRLQEEEQAVLMERRKWVMNKIVILQANGTVNQNERAMLQRLRSELRACEAKLEVYANEFAVAAPLQGADNREAASKASLGRPPSGSLSARPSSGSRRGGSRPASASRHGRSESPTLAAAPPERPHQGVSMSPRSREYLPQQPGATGQRPGDTDQLMEEKFGFSTSSGKGRPGINSPQFGSGDPEPSRTTYSPEFGARKAQQPIYEWPFEKGAASAVHAPPGPPPVAMMSPRSPGVFSPRSLSSPHATRLKPLDFLTSSKDSSPLRPSLADASQPRGSSIDSRDPKLPSVVRSRSNLPHLPPVPLTSR